MIKLIYCNFIVFIDYSDYFMFLVWKTGKIYLIFSATLVLYIG